MERPMTASEIASRLRLDKAGIHRHLKELLEADLVARTDSPRKWVYYTLTEKGHAARRAFAGHSEDEARRDGG